MDKPTNAEIFENTLATFWLDKDGIVNMIAKPVARTLERTQSLVKDVKKVLGGNRAYYISDINDIGEITAEAGAFYKKEIPTMFKAIAFVTSSEFGRMAGIVMSMLFNPAVPTKLFSSEQEARDWLKELREHGQPILQQGAGRKKIEGKLLVVDDNPNEEHILRYAIKEGNWNVPLEFFSGPEKALKYLKETGDTIFLIISDINMPGMNGFEFKQAIEADEELAEKAIPFIYASNSAAKEDIAKAYDNHVQGYFEKPADINAAIDLLDRIFNYWQVSHHPQKYDL